MTDGDDTGAEGVPEEENRGDGSLADRFEGVRATLGDATEAVSETVRRGGETLDESTEDVRRDAAAGVGSLAERVRTGVETTRRSAESIGNDEDAPVDLPADTDADLPTDGLPVEGARAGLDTTRRSVRQVSDTARSLVLDGGLPVRRAAADVGVRVSVGARAGLTEVTRTVRDADTREVALWGVGTSLALSNPAVAASYSTYALLSAAMAAGMGIGAYVSSHEDTPLDDVDPLTLGLSARRGSKQVGRTGATAALAGAASVAGSQVVDDADVDVEESGYGHWLADADVDAVLTGARRAAAREGDDPWAPVFGAGLGLLAGYVDGPDDEAVGGLLDDSAEGFDEPTAALEGE